MPSTFNDRYPFLNSVSLIKWPSTFCYRSHFLVYSCCPLTHTAIRIVQSSTVLYMYARTPSWYATFSETLITQLFQLHCSPVSFQAIRILRYNYSTMRNRNSTFSRYISYRSQNYIFLDSLWYSIPTQRITDKPVRFIIYHWKYTRLHLNRYIRDMQLHCVLSRVIPISVSYHTLCMQDKSLTCTHSIHLICNTNHLLVHICTHSSYDNHTGCLLYSPSPS